jgi:thiol-disulfide isomerase/thioredoxin
MLYSVLFALMQTVVHTSIPTSLAAEEPKPDGRVYDEERDAAADVDLALSRAAVSGKNVIVIMGANWCHDSKDLAVWLAAPRFAAMMQPRFELVYVDAGTPQSGDGRNQDIIKRFGGKKQKNTPYVMILSSEGKLLNRDDARSWRNASSRGEDAVYAYFAEFIPA